MCLTRGTIIHLRYHSLLVPQRNYNSALEPLLPDPELELSVFRSSNRSKSEYRSWFFSSFCKSFTAALVPMTLLPVFVFTLDGPLCSPTATANANAKTPAVIGRQIGKPKAGF